MTKLIHTSGKRKCAIARVTLRPGTGMVRVNSISLNKFQPQSLRLKLEEPLILADNLSKTVNVDIVVYGGGVSGQIEAARLATARALVQYDKKLEKVFLNYDRHLLVADVRRRETRKPNDSKARAARQKSYR